MSGIISSNWIITYRGQEFVFPNFSGALDNVIVPNGNDSLSRNCPITGERKDKMTDDEKAGFLNLQLTHGNIIGQNWNSGQTQWSKFKESTALLMSRFNSSILTGDFTDIQERLDELLFWLDTYKTLLERNKGYAVVYEQAGSFGSGCGSNGRCREKLCHDSGFWSGAIVQYDIILPEINQQISLVSNVQNTIIGIESGDLSLDVLGDILERNAEEEEEKRLALEEEARRKGIFIALGVVALLVTLYFTFKIIKKKRG
tara:strand:+ start:4491 stop:5264 length:774 start_codon:yes stop_codon:yes gene_type:complete